MSWQERKRLRSLLLSEEAIDVTTGKKAPLAVCLIYPNSYEVGMCNLGFQSVYRLINAQPVAFAERAFLPEGLKLSSRRQASPPEALSSEVLSLESQRRLPSFDLLAFSLSFEGDYLNILRILAAAHIPLQAAQRGASHYPLLIAGGIAISMNPTPLADFFDAFFIGEAEAGFAEVLNLIAQQKQKGQSKEELLALLALNHAAVYCPTVHVPAVHAPGIRADSAHAGIYSTTFNPSARAAAAIANNQARNQTRAGVVSGIAPIVNRALWRDWEKATTYQALLPACGEFADMFLIEISKGCPHRCHFCAAAYSHQTIDFRSLASQKHLLDEGLRRRGKIGLVGTAVADHPELKDFLRYLNERGGKAGVSSLRAERIDGELAKLLVACGVDTVAIGCEAASEKMRWRIGKKLSERRLFEAVVALAEGGVKNIRLYFMLGIPEEDLADCQAIISLTKELRQCAQKNSSRKEGFGKITVSINLFIPKAGTPLERAPLISLKEAKKRMALVSSALAKERGIELIMDSPRAALVQALFSQGDASIGELLLAAYQNGGAWQEVLREHRQKVDLFVYRAKPACEPLPWSFIKQM